MWASSATLAHCTQRWPGRGMRRTTIQPEEPVFFANHQYDGIFVLNLFVRLASIVTKAKGSFTLFVPPDKSSVETDRLPSR